MRLILLLALLLASFTYAHDARFRFLLEPGTENCFYEDVRKIGNFIEYSYKVEKGGASGLQFVVRDPAKNIVTEDRTKLKIIKKKFLSKSWGEYQFCFRHVLPYFPEKKIEFMYNSVEDPLMEPLTHEQRTPSTQAPSKPQLSTRGSKTSSQRSNWLYLEATRSWTTYGIG